MPKGYVPTRVGGIQRRTFNDGGLDQKGGMGSYAKTPPDGTTPRRDTHIKVKGGSYGRAKVNARPNAESAK